MPATTAHLEPDEKHQITSARGAILGVYLFALLICSCRVSGLPSARTRSTHPSFISQQHALPLSVRPASFNSYLFCKLYVRRCILHAFQFDDWACVAAIISTTAFAALSLAVIEYGAGRHLKNIALDDARIFYYVRSILALKYDQT